MQFRNLRASSSGVFIIDDDSGVRRIDRAENVTVVVPRPSGDRIFDAVRSRDGSYYVANGQSGLQHVRTGQPNEVYVANGPETYRAFSLVADARSNIVDVFTGGYSERYFPLGSKLGFYEYNAGQWTNFTSSTLPSTTDFPDPINPSRGVRTPEGRLYVASFGGWAAGRKGPKDFRQFTSGIGGSPIQTYAVPNNDRISDVTSDAAGNVWVLNPHGLTNTSGLYRYTPSTDTWLTVPWAPNFENLDRVTLDDQGLVWATVARKPNNPGISGQSEGGLYAVDPDPATTNRPRFFTIADGLPDNQLYEVAKDRRGYIWVASIKGVAVFSDPRDHFCQQTPCHSPRPL